MKHGRWAAAMVLGAVIGVSAQEGRVGTPVAKDDARWIYPRGGRDPLVPPPELYTGQDLPDLVVLFIGVDRHFPRDPIAVVRLMSDPPVRRVIRPGDRLGAYRILAIGPKAVRVAAPTFGGTAVMDLGIRDSASTPTQ